MDTPENRRRGGTREEGDMNGVKRQERREVSAAQGRQEWFSLRPNTTGSSDLAPTASARGAGCDLHCVAKKPIPESHPPAPSRPAPQTVGTLHTAAARASGRGDRGGGWREGESGVDGKGEHPQGEGV
eukprot:3940998-Rhodomonas_salina.2